MFHQPPLPCRHIFFGQYFGLRLYGQFANDLFTVWPNSRMLGAAGFSIISLIFASGVWPSSENIEVWRSLNLTDWPVRELDITLSVLERGLDV